VDWDKVNTPLGLPGMRQAAALRKRFTPVAADVENRPDEWRYYATSAPHYHAPPSLLARAIRGHWGIENQLHYPKDYTQGEDRHVLRTGNAPSNLSLLRSMVLVLLSRIDIPDLVSQTFPQKMAYFSGNVERVVRALSGETEN
jgi:hypothetical protein